MADVFYRVATLTAEGDYHQTVSGDGRTLSWAEGDARDFARANPGVRVGIWKVVAPPAIPELIKEINDVRT